MAIPVPLGDLIDGHKGYRRSRLETLCPEGGAKAHADIKPTFQSLMTDLVQTSKRPDISTADADCITSTIRELLQISKELSSYEYLITIEKEIKDFGDNSPVQGVVKFAIEKSNTILTR